MNKAIAALMALAVSVSVAAVASAAFAGTPDDQLGGTFAGDSVDMIFSSPGPEPIVGVGFTALLFDVVNFTLFEGDLTIRAYDGANTLLLTQALFGGD
jgi:hypothetical protein